MIDDVFMVFMRRCAEFDLTVNAWNSVESTDDVVRSMIDHGVDGLITEWPEQAMRLRSDGSAGRTEFGQ